jgi:hypothetical protein
MTPRVLPIFAAASLLAFSAGRAEVKITPEKDVVHVEIDGKPFTDFILRGDGTMKPYLHPLRSADGKIVTRHFPMEKVEGEPTDHPHHRGLWFAHERVNGFDFWNNEESYTTPIRGRIEVAKIDETKSGADAGTIKATMNWVSPAGEKLVEESRTMTFRGDARLRIIDLDITLTATAPKVTFGDAKDGTLGIRLAAPLDEAQPKGKDGGNIPGTGKITNAEGQSSEKTVWGKPSDWMDYSGTLDGEKLGIAIFDHPQNAPRARWHVRGYGLFAANPFGQSVFSGDKSKSGNIDLAQGEKLHLQYRVIIHSGDTASADLPKLWQEYTASAK